MILELPPRWRARVYPLLALYAAWLAVGIFPVAPLEGDEQGVINGATAMARSDLLGLELAYLPIIQPGSYAVLSIASRWSGLGVEPLFALGTVFGAVAFAILAAAMLARVLNLPSWLTGASLLAAQEISAAAYYLNTSALGLWLTFAALYLALRPPTWRTASLMAAALGVAGWIRIDCLLPAPAVPVLLWIATRDLRIVAHATVAIALGSLLLVSALYFSCGVTWLDLVSTYTGRGAISGWGPTLRAMPLVLSPLSCGFLVAGLVLLAIRRDWPVLALLAAGCAATLPIYGTSLASTKYFYHLVPFFLLGSLSAFAALVARLVTAPRPLRFAGGVFLLGLLIANQTVAPHTSSTQFRRYAPSPVLLPLATIPRADRPWSLVIGPGEIIPTADGFRLRGGAVLAPLVWRREKLAMREQLARFSALLADAPATTVYYSGWLPYQIITRILRDQGYTFQSRRLAANSMPYSGLWARGDRTVRTDYLAYRTSEYFDPVRQPVNSTGEHTYFLGDLNVLEPITALADSRTWQPLWPEHGHRFVTFLQRRAPAPSVP